MRLPSLFGVVLLAPAMAPVIGVNVPSFKARWNDPTVASLHLAVHPCAHDTPDGGCAPRSHNITDAALAQPYALLDKLDVPPGARLALHIEHCAGGSGGAPDCQTTVRNLTSLAVGGPKIPVASSIPHPDAAPVPGDKVVEPPPTQPDGPKPGFPWCVRISPSSSYLRTFNRSLPKTLTGQRHSTDAASFCVIGAGAEGMLVRWRRELKGEPLAADAWGRVDPSHS